MSIAKDYDDVPYKSVPVPQSWPGELATVATLFGMEPPNIRSARVLELGSATGGNLLAMARLRPNASFTGIDLSAVQVNEGQRNIHAQGLANVTLQQGDIRDIGTDWGKFDYIIAHGVWSWVPDPVRNKILCIVRENLNPNGVAYISYNALPGWYTSGFLRDILLLHTAGIPDAKEKISAARAILKFLEDSFSRDNSPFAKLILGCILIQKKCPDSCLRHDLLSPVNDPFYFHEFMKLATDNGLQYLGESPLALMFGGDLDSPVHQRLAQFVSGLAATEQYMDFVRNRMFRQTLLVHRDVRLQRTLSPNVMEKFSFRSNAVPQSENFDASSRASEEFETMGRGRFTTAEPVFKSALSVLAKEYPNWVAFNELAQATLTRLVAQSGDPTSANGITHVRSLLAASLLKTCMAGLVEIAIDPPPVPEERDQGAISP